MPNETRVVEMQFKNKEFEKNIETSQKSLEKFKKELNFDDTSKGLKKFGESMEELNISKLANNIQKLTDKFTGLGTVSEYVMSRVRREIEQAADSALRFAKSLTFDQVSAGKAKFDELNKSVQSIMAATGKTQDEVLLVMERLNAYTDATSYNFADMASNISKFTSVGIPLEQAEKQMEGIANWAARSGAGINEASRAMYNLSQAMGMGSLRMMDWRSIENAGMATKEFKEQMLEAGAAAGTLEKSVKKNADGTEEVVYKTAKSLGKQVEVTYQNMSSTLSKGWANTTVIGSTLMGYYYDELDGSATEKIKELTDDQKTMLTDMFKEVSTIDAKGWKKLSDQGVVDDASKQKLLDIAVAQGTLTEEVTKDGEKIYTTLDKTGKKIQFTFSEFEKGLTGNWLTKNVANVAYGFDNLAQSSFQAAQRCRSFSDVLNAWKDMISTGWMTSFQHIFGNLSESMALFSGMCDKVGEKLGEVFGPDGTLNKLLSAWEGIGGRDSLWSLLLGEMTTPDGDILYEGAYGLLDVLHDIQDMISEAFWEVVGSFAADNYTEEQMEGWMDDPAFRMQYLAERIKEFTERIRDFIVRVKEFFKEIPEGASKSRWDMIKDVVKAVFHVISLAAQVIGGLFHFFGKIREQLSPSINAIVELFSILTGGIISTEKGVRKGKGITKFFNTLAEILKPITAVINKIVVGITELIKAFVKWGKDSGFFIDAWNKIKMAVKGIWNFISGIGTSIGHALGGIIEAFKELFKGGFNKDGLNAFKAKIKETFSGMWSGLKSAVGPAVKAIGAFFARIWAAVSNALAGYFGDENTVGYKIINWLRGAFETLKGGLNRIVPGAVDSIGGFFKKIGDFIVNMFNGGVDFLGSIKNIWNKVSTAVKDFFSDGVVGTIKNIWRSIRDFFTNLFNPKGGGVEDTVEDIKDTAAAAGEKISSTVESVITKPKSFGQALLDAFHAVSEFLSNLTTEQWVLIGAVAAVIAIFLVIRKTVKRVFRIVEDIVAIKKAESIVPSLQTFAGKMLLLAASVGIIALSIKLIGEMDVGNGVQGIIGVAAIMALMFGFFKLMKGSFVGANAMTGKEVTKMVLALVGIAIAVGRMVKAITPLAKYNMDELGIMLSGMVTIMMAMIAVAYVAGKNNFDWKSGAGFLLFALSIAVLIGALSLILLFRDDTEALLLMLGTLTIIVVEFGVLAKLAKNNKGVLYLAALAAAIAIMIFALTKVADYNLKQIVTMLGTLTGILGLMLLFVKLFPKKGTLDNTGLWQVIPLAVGIYILIKALMPIANLEWHQVIKMLAVYGVVILGLIGMIWAINKFEGTLDKNNNAVRGMSKSGMGAIITMALGIAVLILALKQVAKIGDGDDWSGVAKMLVVYAVIVGGIIALIAVVNKTADKENGRGFKKSGLFGGLLALVLGIAGIIEVLKPLAGTSWESLAKMFAPFALIMIGLIVLIHQVSKFTKTDKQGNQAFKIILGFVLMLQTIVYIMKKSENMDTAKLAIMFGGLTLIFLAMALVMNSVAKFTKDKKNGTQALMVLIGFCGVILVFAQAMHLVKNIDAGTMLAFAASLVILSVALAIITSAFSKMKAPANGKEFAAKFGMMILVLAAVAGLAGILALFAPMMRNSSEGDIAKLLIGVAVLSGVVGILVAELNALKTSTKKNKIKSKIEFMATAIVAVAALMLAFVLIGPMASNLSSVNWEDLGKAIAGTLALAVIAGVIVKEMNSLKVSNKKNETSAKLKLMAECIIAIAAFMAIYAICAPAMVGVNWQTAATFIGGVLVLVAAVGLMVLAINKLDVSASKDKLEKKITMFGLALGAVASIMLIYGALTVYLGKGSDLNYGNLIAYIAGCVIMIAMVCVLVAAINKLDVSVSKDKLEKKMQMFELILGAIAGVMLIFGVLTATGALGNTNWENMAAYILGCVVMIAMACVLVAAINKLDVSVSKDKLTKKLELIGVAIGAVVIVMAVFGAVLGLGALNNANWETMAAYILGCAVMLLMVSVLVSAINKLEIPEKSSEYFEKLAMIIILMVGVAGIMYVMSLSLEKVKDVDWTTIAAFALGVILVSVILIKSLSKNSTSSGKKMLSTLITMLSVCAVMYVMSLSLENVKDIDWTTIAAFAAGLLVIALAMKVLSTISIGGAIKGAIALAAGLVAISAVLPLVGDALGRAIEEIAGSLDTSSILIVSFAKNMGSIDEADIDKAVRIIEKIGGIFMSLYGFKKYVSDLDEFSTSVYELGVILAAFHRETKELPAPENSPGIKTIKEFIKMKDSLKNMSIPTDLGANIARLGAGLWIFGDLTKGLTASNSGEDIPAVQLLRTLGGLSDVYTSLGGTDGLGTQIGNLGSGLGAFLSNTKDITPDDLNSSGLGLLTALADNAEGIKTIMGLELDKLADQLTLLGGGMTIYALGAQKVTEAEKLGNAPDISAATSIFTQVVGQLSGEDMKIDLPDVPDEEQSVSFGAKMAALAGGLEAFVGACDGINGKTELGLAAVALLAGIQKDLSADAVQVVSIFGNNGVNVVGIGAFGLQMWSLASGLSRFIGACEGWTSKTQNGIDAVKALSEINTALTETYVDAYQAITYWDGREITKTMLADFGTDMVTLAEGLEKFNGAAAKATDVSNALTMLEKLNEINAKLTELSIDEMTANLEYLTGIEGLQEKNVSMQTLVAQHGLSSVVDMTGERFEVDSEIINSIAAGGHTSPLSKFATAIEVLSSAMSQFTVTSTMTEGYKTAIDYAVELLNYFVGLEHRMPEKPGLIKEWLIGYNGDLGDLSKHVEALGTKLKEFGEKIAPETVDIDKVYKAVESIALIVNAYSTMYHLMEEIYSKRFEHGMDEVVAGNMTDYEFLSTYFNDFTTIILNTIADIAKPLKTLSDYLNRTDIRLSQEQLDKVHTAAETIFALYSAIATILPETGSIKISAVTFFEQLETELETMIGFSADNNKLTHIYSIMTQMIDILQSFTSIKLLIDEINANFTDDVSKQLANKVVGFLLAIQQGLIEANLSLDTATSLSTLIDNIVQELNNMSTLSPDIEKFTEVGSTIAASIGLGFLSQDAINCLKSGLQIALAAAVGELSETDREILALAPIINMDEAKRKFEELQGKAGTTLSFMADQGLTIRFNDTQLQTLTPKDYTAQFTSLSETVGALQTNLAEVNKKLESFRVVMDTGAMVGALGPGINLYIGRDSFEAGRGIYNGIATGTRR